MYGAGYVFTRVDRGVMNKTRSFRVNLSTFELSSENRRILRKVENLMMTAEPIPYSKYDWKIGKMAKDFYEKFGDAVFTANKAKEIMTDGAKSNFNTLLVFKTKDTNEIVGYVICYVSNNIIHYSFPFYIEASSRGLGMMTMMLDWAKSSGKAFAYLGSLQRPSDTYKLQFAGGEWFDGEKWQTDTTALKEILRP